jgi:hypothetical protein
VVVQGVLDWITFLFLEQLKLPFAFLLTRLEQIGCLLREEDNELLTLSLPTRAQGSEGSLQQTPLSNEPELNEIPNPTSY